MSKHAGLAIVGLITAAEATFRPGDEERLLAAMSPEQLAHLERQGAITGDWRHPGGPAAGDYVLVVGGEMLGLDGMSAREALAKIDAGAQIGIFDPAAEHQVEVLPFGFTVTPGAPLLAAPGEPLVEADEAASVDEPRAQAAEADEAKPRSRKRGV